MKALGILLIVVLAVFLYILLRFILKRIFLWVCLKRFAKKHNFQCKIAFTCLLPSNRTGTVQIESAHTIYQINLFGLLRKHCEIHFWNTQEYSVEWYFSRYGLVGSTPIGQTNAKRRRSLGNRDWGSSISDKEVVPVLLIDPANAPVRLTQTQVNHLVDLRVGEKIENILFADRDFLFRFIENREK